MRQFLKYTFATIVGILLCLFFLVIAAMLFLYFAAQDQSTSIEPNSLLHLKLNYAITDRTQPEGLGLTTGDFALKSNLGVNDILKNIEKAKTDDNIKGIFLDLSNLTTGMALTDEIRQQLVDFKTSGKFIVAYSELMTQKAYYLASIADAVYLNPQGLVLLKGFSSQLMFVKEALDRLGIEPEIFYAGNFKSATEPLRYTKMSDYNRLQTRALLNGFEQSYIEQIAEARKMTTAELNNIINELKVQEAKDAKQYRLVDELYYIDEVREQLKNRLGLDADDKLSLVSLSDYDGVPATKKTKYHEPKIAIVYAEGDINTGKSDEGIASDNYVETLRQLREDDKVKAVVLRVNSGGGSALASDIILRELNLLQQKGIPVIASFGDVAASGGYYIAAHADTIVAEENTITGSIGVFGLTMELDKFYRNKLGFTFDTVKTARYSDFPTSPLLNRQYSDAEKTIMQRGVDKIYEDFLNVVAKGRGMTRDQVHEIAQGRVWRGETAREIGLIDVIGNCETAVQLAAKRANLADDSYRVAEYPDQPDAWERIKNEISGNQSRQQWLQTELGDYYTHYNMLKKLNQMNGAQMRMPFEIIAE